MAGRKLREEFERGSGRDRKLTLGILAITLGRMQEKPKFRVHRRVVDVAAVICMAAGILLGVAVLCGFLADATKGEVGYVQLTACLLIAEVLFFIGRKLSRRNAGGGEEAGAE